MPNIVNIKGRFDANIGSQVGMRLYALSNLNTQVGSDLFLDFVSAGNGYWDYSAELDIPVGNYQVSMYYTSATDVINVSLQLPTVYLYISTGVNTAILTNTLGAGSDFITIKIEDDNVPVENVSVWITSDLAGTITVSGPLLTNNLGQVLCLLTSGNTYYLWAFKEGKTSILGYSFIAIAD